MVKGCRKCEYCYSKPTGGNPYTIDCYCSITRNHKTIVRYVEFDCQIPDKRPKWCPLRKCEDVSKE